MNVLNVMSEWDYRNERVLFRMDLNGDVEWPPSAAINAAIRRSMESNRFCISACGREFHIACMRSKSSSFEAAGCRSLAERRPTI
ncbi:hypothetical protein TNCV_3377571 [Trichonephila clavipes]|nr:hypothetical protein TNCV_3377571 [Trichonephila clavipes]